MPAAPVIDLSNLTAAQGFIIQGDAADDWAGKSVSSAGDVNGDGVDDLIVGVHFGGNSGLYAGEAYVIYGRAGSTRSTVDLSNLTAAQGFIIQGDAAGDQAGYSVSSAGDVNGDGIDDLIVGAPFGDDGGINAGEAYVIYGVAGSTRGTVDLSDLVAAQGFVIQGDAAGDRAGGSVSSVGDVNGDGIDDLIVGAMSGDDGGNNAGEAYVIYGVAGSTRGTLDLSNLTAAQGFIIQGDAAGDQAGTSVSSAGDVNGDGIDDLIVGAPRGDDGGINAGEAYVIYGGSNIGVPPPAAPVVDLSSLNASQGFIIQGDAAYDAAGFSVSSAGDVNGDGIDDLIVGAPSGDDGGFSVGEAYVVYGQSGIARGTVDLSILTAPQGFIIQGDAANDFAGQCVSSAGDVNGDGIDDLIVGVPYGDDGGFDAGEAYVVYGQAGSTRGTVDLSILTAAQGFIIQGDAPFDRAGYSVSSAGDVNGDGIDDIIVGAPDGDDGGDKAGEAYVIYGQAGSARGTVDLSALTAAQGFIIQGDAAGDSAGFSVSSAGDVNGDDIDDLIVGAPNGDDGGNFAGEAYVVYGQAGSTRGTVDLSTLTAAQGFIIQGDAEGDQAGQSVSSAGDVNGDGIDDLIVGGPYGNDGGFDAGEAYVVYGQAGSTRGTVDLSALTAAQGFIIQGDAAFDSAGRSVSSAGDVNGDGINDLIVGAPKGDDGGDFAGEAYVVYGQAGSKRGTVDLSTLTAAQGFIIRGDAATDFAGFSVSSAGDVNGDGIDDLIVGAQFGDDGGNNTGDAYVIYGSRDFGQPEPASDTVREGTDTTATLNVGSTQSGVINVEPIIGDGVIFDSTGGMVDKDWLRVTLQGGQAYRFDGSADVSGTDNLDAIAMSLYRDDVTRVTPVVDGATPTLEFTAPGTGPVNYYLAVSAGGTGDWQSKTGAFQVTMTNVGAGTAVNHRPEATAIGQSPVAGTSIALSDLFTYLDPDGAADITSFAVQDRTPGNGYLTFDGEEQRANKLFESPIAELARWAFVAGDGTDQVGFNAVDQAGTFNPTAVATIVGQPINAPIDPVVKKGAEDLFQKTDGKLATLATFAHAAYDYNWPSLSKLADAGWNFLGSADGLTDMSGNYFVGASVFSPVIGFGSAIAATSEDGKDLVLAFRGTDNIVDWVNDALGISRHYALFSQFLDELNFEKFESIYITGHSLGAAMAQKLVEDSRFGFSNNPNVSSITFANPGYGGIAPWELDQDRFINISMEGDPVAAAGTLGRAVGDVYTLDHDGLSPINFDLHRMDWYLAAAKTLAGTSLERRIEDNQLNDTRDRVDISVRLEMRPWEEEWVGLIKKGSLITPQGVQAGTATSGDGPSDLWAVSTNAGSTPAIFFDAPQYTSTEYEVSATPTGEVVIRDVIGTTLFLASEFSSLQLGSGIAGAKFLIKKLITTDILDRTIYFQGNIGQDIVDGTDADRRIVAWGRGEKDTLIGGSSDDILDGGADNDLLDGGNGNDDLLGVEGDDTLTGGAGNDTLTGGAGIDTASYAGAVSGVTLNLGLATAQVTGGAGTDVLGGIENLTGSGFNDVLTGSTAANRIEGGVGNDRLTGGAGADTLYGGEGNDLFVISAIADHAAGEVIEGDGGTDELRFAGAVAGTLVLGAGVDVERVVIGTGTAAAAVLTATTAINVDASAVATGLTMIGNAGANRLTGTALGDSLEGGSGNDTLMGGAGNDTLTGGAGLDVASYASATGDLAITLVAAGPVAVAGFGTDSYSGIEGLEGGSGNDSLTGDAGANLLLGGGGDDTLTGGAGNDTLTGGAGADDLRGGEGNDLFLVWAIADHAAGEAIEGDGGTDELRFTGAVAGALVLGAGVDVERVVIGTGTAAAAVLTGTTAINVDASALAQGVVMIGNAGSNRLTGSGFADSLTGGGGNDTLNGGAGNDTLTGGVGVDVASYASATSGLTIGLGAATLAAGGDFGIDVLSGIEGLEGGLGDDSLTGDAGANFLLGGEGNDTLNGGLGNDTLAGGAGDDTLTGGAGLDVASYASATGDLVITLVAAGPVAVAGFGTDSYSGIEGLEGGSGNDSLTGDAGANLLLGGGGDDTLTGGAGNDTLTGGAGIDTASYAGAASGVTLNLGLATAQVTGGAGTDVLGGIENLVGSGFNDVLTGSTAANRIEGGVGNDRITGGAGADTLYGGEGNDLFVISAIADHAAGEAIEGDGGTDELRFTGAVAGTLVLGAGVDVERVVIGTGTAAAAVLTATTAINVDASALAQGVTMIGNAGANRLTGGTGNDSLEGGAGNDTLHGVAGNDTLVGGAGLDVASYASATGDLVITLVAAGPVAVAGFGTDSYSGIEGLEGGSGNDSLTGDAGANLLLGGSGDDTLTGGAGNDTLTGGAGIDTASYAGAVSGVTLNLGLATAQVTGGAGTDVLGGIENLVGSGFNDVLTGSLGANRIEGGVGNDRLTGGAGADTLYGGEGNDLFVISAFADHAVGEVIEGDGGTDELRFTGAVAGTLVLGAGVDVERVVIGTGTAAAAVLTATTAINVDASALARGVTMIGNAGANRLTGTALGDSLEGGLGNDTLHGGAGDDTLVGGAGLDVASYASATGDVVITLVAAGPVAVAGFGTDSYSGIEGLEGGSGDDSLTGDAGANLLLGGEGDDTLTGGAGNDTLTGGAGIDTASYAGAASGVTLNLGLATAQVTGGAGTDVLGGIENLVGSGFNDVLTGSTAANRIEGGVGNDRITGGAGADTLYGGEGNDLFVISAFADHAVGEVIEGDGGTDELRFTGAVAGTLTLGAGVDVERVVIGTGTAAAAVLTATTAINVDASALARGVTMIGNAGANRLTGTALGDSLEGGLGNDTLHGGAGDDTLVGGSGNDVLTGGTGSDEFVFRSRTSGVDTISDFNNLDGGGDDGDVLVFEGLGVGIFAYLGAGAFTGGSDNSEARVSGSQVLVDTNGDGVADITIALAGLSNASQLAVDDFLFV